MRRVQLLQSAEMAWCAYTCMRNRQTCQLQRFNIRLAAETHSQLVRYQLFTSTAHHHQDHFLPACS